jgi:hypothetical protein
MPAVRDFALPDYGGGCLLNLVAELEHRLTGRAASPLLHAEAAAAMPDAAGYVLVLFDGLGARQLTHPAAAGMAADLVTRLDAPFPTTTTVSLATIASGLPPSQHGLIGYQMWMPELGVVVNTIKWTTLWGQPVEFDTSRFLPFPNLWERLRSAGLEPVTVQPRGFDGSPLSRLLYRGCRFEGVATVAELIDATLQLAATPGRLVLTYVPQVDFAAHVYGQDAAEYAEALAIADTVWTGLAARLPPGVALIGTADHGHVDFPRDRQFKIPRPDHEGRIFWGDGRAMYVNGDGRSLADRLPAVWRPRAEVAAWWGPGLHEPALADRIPDGVLLADEGWLLLHRHSDDRMLGNHGGLTAAERRVPLLVAAGREGRNG